MKKRSLSNAIAAIALVIAGDASAQSIRPAYQFPLTPAGSGPASVQVAQTPIFFTPYLGLAVGHDDNLFLSNTDKRSSTVFVTSPGFRFDARDANKVAQASYQAQLGRYADSDDDNYIDHAFRGQFDVAIDHRNFLRLGYEYLRGHDMRGATDRPISSTPDRYTSSTPSLTYAFGAPGAQGRVEAYYSDGLRKYLNNRALTIASDRSTQEFGGAFYWRVMPKTYLMAEARRTDFSYRLPNSPFSSTEERYYGGISWEASAATTGTVKFGRLKKEFDSGIPEFSGSSWEAIVAWSPRTYSRFDFYAMRTTNESTGLGNFILSDIAGVAWTHSWSSVLSTGLDARYQKDRYKGFDRNDDSLSLGLKVGYKFRRWLTLGAEYTYTQRDSSSGNFDYDRNLYLLTATGSL